MKSCSVFISQLTFPPKLIFILNTYNKYFRGHLEPVWSQVCSSALKTAKLDFSAATQKFSKILLSTARWKDLPTKSVWCCKQETESHVCEQLWSPAPSVPVGGLGSAGRSCSSRCTWLHLALLPARGSAIAFLPLSPLISPNGSRERLQQRDLPWICSQEPSPITIRLSAPHLPPAPTSPITHQREKRAGAAA